jgi:hypothetical protein
MEVACAITVEIYSFMSLSLEHHKPRSSRCCSRYRQVPNHPHLNHPRMIAAAIDAVLMNMFANDVGSSRVKGKMRLNNVTSGLGRRCCV